MPQKGRWVVDDQCANDKCNRKAASLCRGHLREFILAALASVIDDAAVQQWASMEPDDEDE